MLTVICWYGKVLLSPERAISFGPVDMITVRHEEREIIARMLLVRCGRDEPVRRQSVHHRQVDC